MRAVGYLRVSDDKQVENYSLPAQRRQFEEHCQTKGWTPVGIYAEEGKSARFDAIEKRPVFKRLLAETGSGRFDIIVVHSLDRWSRNLKVTLETFKLMAEHRIAFVSLTENIDYSTPEGRLFVAMIGAFAQYFSDSLSKHISKGKRERALQGLYNGPVPFGYERCDCCDAKVHPHAEEAPAVREIFERYASGTATLSQLAGWLNEQGFRTRNTRTILDAQDAAVTGPRRFTLYSVRWILHNAFFAGLVKLDQQLLPGVHRAIVTRDLYDRVQKLMLAASNGRSTASPTFKKYLLKGLVRCVYCGMNLWAETPGTTKAYYREKRGTRASSANCPAEGKSILASTVDTQVGWLIEGMSLQESWRERVLTKMAGLADHRDYHEQRRSVEDKLKRLGRAYVDGLIDEVAYQLQQRQLRSHLEALVIPETETTLDAGALLEDLGLLWRKASLEERRTILSGMVEAFYVDLTGKQGLVGVRPRPAFRPVLETIQASPEARARLVVSVETGENRTPRPAKVNPECPTGLADIWSLALSGPYRQGKDSASQ